MAVDSPQPLAFETWLARLGTPARRVLLLRGSLALLFGVLALPWPGVTLTFLFAMFGVWMGIVGLGALTAAIRNRRRLPAWRWTFVLGIACLVAAVAAQLYPGPALLALALAMGCNALATGVIDAVLAAHWPTGPRHAAMQMMAGATSIVFSAVALFSPVPSAQMLAFMVGTYAILHGALLLLQAMHREAWGGAPSRRDAGRPHLST